jgi:hypothetical protein
MNDVWTRVDELIERAERPSDLRWHRLHLIGAARLRERGLPVPHEFVPDEFSSTVMTLAAPELLRRVRETLDGPVVLLKGPEVAALYPEPTLRPFRDLDLLVPAPHEAWRSLVQAGFVATGDPTLYVDIHHLRPLYLPGYPLVIELHSKPKWVPWVAPPSAAELFAAAVPSATGVDGILAPAPAHHAVALAAHSWAHEPLRRVHELLDVLLVTAQTDREEAARVSQSFGVARLWRITVDAADAVLGDGRRPLALAIWARNLERVRERTVLESHLEHLLAPFSIADQRVAARMAGRALGRDLRPEEGESWGDKFRRTVFALRDATTRASDHDQALAERVNGEAR